MVQSEALASTSAEERGFAPAPMALRGAPTNGGVTLGSPVSLGTQGQSWRQKTSDCEQWGEVFCFLNFGPLSAHELRSDLAR